MLSKRGHNFYMQEVLKESARALEEGEVPVGAVAVYDGRIIGRAHNQKEQLKDPTAHAEMIAITQAASALDNWRLKDVDFYVTIEPCPMCAGALVQARVRRIIFGALDPKAGACGSLFNIVNDKRLNHRIEIISGVMEPECRAILQDFFQVKRNTGNSLNS